MDGPCNNSGDLGASPGLSATASSIHSFIIQKGSEFYLKNGMAMVPAKILIPHFLKLLLALHSKRIKNHVKTVRLLGCRVHFDRVSVA